MHTLTNTRPGRSAWKNDSAIDRIRARVRLIVAVALVAVMLGGAFGATITNAMRPLIAAVDQLGAAAH